MAASNLSFTVPWHSYAVIYRDDGTPSVSFELPTRTTIVGSQGSDPVAPGTRVGTSLADAISARANGGPPTNHVVVAWIRDDGRLRDGLPTKEVWRGWVEGTLTTQHDWEDTYDSAMLVREEVVEDLIDDALAALTGSVNVVGRGSHMPFVVLAADVDSIAAWVAADVFGVVEKDKPLADEATGGLVEAQMGTAALYGPSYSSTTPDLRQYDGAPSGIGAAVILEALGPPRHDHPVIMNSGGSFRPLTKTILANASGYSVMNTADILCDASSAELCHVHALQMVQAFGGDVTLGQLSPSLSHGDAVDRSGIARGAAPQLATSGGTVSGYLHALDRLATRRNQLINTSFQTTSANSACEQDGVDARALNEAYALGTAIIKSAGNTGNNALNRCEITRPGGAAGAFVVGSVADDAATWYTGSSRGHRTRRTIVDVAAYNFWDHDARLDGSIDTPPSNQRVGGTSTATALVSGAAWLHLQQLTDRSGLTPLNDDPGLLHAHLLLMGDGVDGEGGFHSSGYSRMTGSGFLRLLRMEGDDMGPFFSSGAVCVDQDSSVHLHLASALPPGTSSIRAVAHWVDRRTEQGLDANRIDMELSATGVGIVGVDAGDDEDKRRIRANGAFGGEALTLSLVGFDVRGSEDPFCPRPDSQRVWFAVQAM